MNSNIFWLSHPLSPETPAYGNGERMRIEQVTRIANGDTANSYRFILPNHLGTHVDAPRHFFDSGPSLIDYPPEFWIFENPLLVDVPGEDGYLIGPMDVENAITNETDILLLRTGYEKYRETDRYWEHNPGLSPDLADWLRKNFPNLRMIGMDVISVTSRHRRRTGRTAHRAFLDPDLPGNSVLLIEDMALKHINESLKRLVVAPLRVARADSGSCTVICF